MHHHQEHDGLWVGIWMVSVILGLLWNEGDGACSHRDPLKPFYKNVISISIIPQISKQSVQWSLELIRTKSGQILACLFGAFDSAILKIESFVTLSHNFILIFIKSQNFRPILPVVTEKRTCAEKMWTDRKRKRSRRRGKKKKKQNKKHEVSRLRLGDLIRVILLVCFWRSCIFFFFFFLNLFFKI